MLTFIRISQNAQYHNNPLKISKDLIKNIPNDVKKLFYAHFTIFELFKIYSVWRNLIWELFIDIKN